MKLEIDIEIRIMMEIRIFLMYQSKIEIGMN
jgi:hypothetical protein